MGFGAKGRGSGGGKGYSAASGGGGSGGGFGSGAWPKGMGKSAGKSSQEWAGEAGGGGGGGGWGPGGAGPGWGKQGRKGAGGSAQWFAEETQPHGADVDAAAGGRLGRLMPRYAFSKACLRAWADETGSCLYADGSSAFFKQRELDKYLTDGNSAIFRHPATGISVCASSAPAGAAVLDQLSMASYEGERGKLSRMGAPKLAALLGTDAGQDFRLALNTLNYKDSSHKVASDALSAALTTAEAFVRKNRRLLFAELPRMAISSSRMYLMSMQFLEFATAFGDLEKWALKIHDAETEHRSLRAWKKRPKDLATFVLAMKTLFKAPRAGTADAPRGPQ